nr:hypothetical protein [Tanacetum cinerariifolium]
VGGLCWGKWWRRWVSSGSGGDGLGKRGEVVAGSGGKTVVNSGRLNVGGKKDVVWRFTQLVPELARTFNESPFGFKCFENSPLSLQFS